ncbi:MAG: nuclear transport factor 2 family protein [Solirubrobacterales bacterium]
MDDAQIAQACRELILTITQHVDHGEAEQAAALFAEDGVLARAGKEFSGREQLVAAYTDPPNRLVRHVNGGTVVNLLDADHATAVTYFIAYRHEAEGEAVELPAPLGTPFSLGEWHDGLVRTEAGWRFSSRRTKRIFAGA